MTVKSNRNKKKRFLQKKDGLKDNWRITLLFFITLFIGGAIFYRLFVLQIKNFDDFTNKAKAQHQFFEKLVPRRGNIYIKDGENNRIPVATNEDRDTVVVIPKLIEDTEGTIQTLATLLSLDSEEVRKKVIKKDDPYEIIKKKITLEQSEIIRAKKMKGVELINEVWRVYPEGDLASQILGFVGYEGDKRKGRYGVEGYFDEILEGEFGFIKAEKDTAGRWISFSKRVLEKPKDGKSIVLTIDQTIQYFVENLLKESIEKYGATSGSVIVMDPNDGKILAMANYPTFNSNEFNKVEDSALFKNNCISSQYEPGSIFKPITASIPIDLGKLEPDSTYNDTGSFPIAGFTIKNSDGKAYGKITLTRFLELSLNTGSIWCMQTAGQKDYLEYLKKYGLGNKTGIELIGEENGNIRNLENGREINFITASFGQGISATPLQLITAFSANINGGILYKPQIIEKIIDSDGSEEVVLKKEIHQVINPKTSAKMRAMLISVVKNGWGKKAGVPGYLIGGKTGTAQIPDPKTGGYSDKTIHSFLGFGPGDEPKFATIIKLDNVSNTRFAESSAGPTTGKLNKFLLDYLHIFPTEEIKSEELERFNKLMELKKEDIVKINKETKEKEEGAEGFLDKDLKKKKKKKD